MSMSYTSSPPCATVGVLWDCFTFTVALTYEWDLAHNGIPSSDGVTVSAQKDCARYVKCNELILGQFNNAISTPNVIYRQGGTHTCQILHPGRQCRCRKHITNCNLQGCVCKFHLRVSYAGIV
jgi:hypothetical protein